MKKWNVAYSQALYQTERIQLSTLKVMEYLIPKTTESHNSLSSSGITMT